MKIKTLKRLSLFFLATMSYAFVTAQVVFEKQIKISDRGLYFDGDKAGKNDANNGNGKYDFIFGKRITPHGDCIKEYNGFVFMTWYRGGKLDRHVMLSRYNPTTGAVKTIEFPHRHTGFQNRWWLGESHNTIAIGISPLDGTIHMLYDMHSYDEDRPADGSFSNDYFRYTYSKKDAATVPDSQFNLDQFVKNSRGGYKHLEMKRGVDYRSLTYPNFFLNKQGELFMWIREGGNDNGAYKFCKYDGNSWSNFKQFNILGARNTNGVDFNWGLYGDIKFSGGKMRIGFATRYNNKNDKYKFNNGFHYAFSDDPEGLTQWKDHAGKSVSLPVVDPNKIKISEPGNLVPSNGKDSVTMSGGADWITTDNEDIHFVGRIQGSDKKWVNVHTYKKAGAANFTTATNFPVGNLYTFNNDVYLIGLAGGRIFVEKAPGGTNNWTRIYLGPARTNSNDVVLFRHGNVYIENGKLYFYLMENGSGNAQPIYLQILDLGLELEEDTNRAPVASLTSPIDGAVYQLGETINLAASATDPDGNLEKVNFKVNGQFYRTDSERPFENTFTPAEAGTYKIAARAFDVEGLSFETEVTITVNTTLSNENFLKLNNFDSVTLYPSPTKDAINLKGLTNVNTEITIVDITGKVILRTSVNKDTAKIDVSAFTNAMYFVKLNNGISQKTMRFIKN